MNFTQQIIINNIKTKNWTGECERPPERIYIPIYNLLLFMIFDTKKTMAVYDECEHLSL